MGNGYKPNYYKSRLYNPCLCTALNTDFFKPVKQYRAHWARTWKRRRKEESFLFQNQKQERKEEDAPWGRITYGTLRQADTSDSQIMLTSRKRTIMDRMLNMMFRSTRVALLKRQWTFWVMPEMCMMILVKMTVEKLTMVPSFNWCYWIWRLPVWTSFRQPGGGVPAWYICMWYFHDRAVEGKGSGDHKISLKQRHKAKEMEAHFVVKYDDGY